MHENYRIYFWPVAKMAAHKRRPDMCKNTKVVCRIHHIGDRRVILNMTKVGNRVANVTEHRTYHAAEALHFRMSFGYNETHNDYLR